MEPVQLFVSVYLKIFFVLTPFFVVTMFLAMTKEFDEAAKHKIALRVTLAIIVISFFLYLFGKYVFEIFGITLDAFRIGAGALLFLSAVMLVHGTPASHTKAAGEDIAVVPLALPIAVGPATTGALLVMGADLHTTATKITASAALLCAVLTVGILLYLAGKIERVLGHNGLTILSKLTGLILASIAAQIIFTGVKDFLGS